MGSANTQATRSTLQSVDTTLSENITATQNYIPVVSTTNFSTSVVAEIESTNEVVSFGTITENLFLYSQDFRQTSYWQYNSSNIETTLYTAPDGTTTANGFTEDSSNVSHNIIRNSLTTVIGQKYTLSIFAKWVGKRYLQLSFGGGDSNPNLAFQNFDIETGVLGSSSGVTNSAITDVGNGWYRCSTVVESAVTTGFIPVIGLIPSTTSGRSAFYTGSGNGDGAQLYIWGAQFEEGDSLTGYLPTTTSSLQGLTNVTRGVNGTTAQAANSGDSIQQLPFATPVDIPIRLRGLSISPDGTGAARLTLCDNNGDSILDIDTPDGKVYTMNMPASGGKNGYFVNFDIVNGITGTKGSNINSSSITDVGNGWFRISMTSNTTSHTLSGAEVCFTEGTSSLELPSFVGNGTDSYLIWGSQIELDNTLSTLLPTEATVPLFGLTAVTRGVNGTTAQAASSGDSIQQLPYVLGSLDMPVRLRAISVSPDGTGNARLTLCDSNGDTLCDVDIPDAKSYTLNMPEDGIIFPNGVFVSNTDNITAYTVYTEKYSGPGLIS